MVADIPPMSIIQNKCFLSCDTVLLEVIFGSFGKGNAFFNREVTYTVTKFRPDGLDGLKGWGVGRRGHTYS